ncbi:MAG TPA: hypothetical protein IAB51_11165 [Candidatus Merdivicinus excrementipullorum]|uniref:Uncharacterized protein n=1 Tax=Candidatus Merdivicinus excrementipullorum TaxID=2840867 RepID=A0A9D1K0I0_9FIRM|nr:hypothetical protein [Candidatus Merdivicinus excrementipullorum]
MRKDNLWKITRKPGRSHCAMYRILFRKNRRAGKPGPYSSPPGHHFGNPVPETAVHPAVHKPGAWHNGRGELSPAIRRLVLQKNEGQKIQPSFLFYFMTPAAVFYHWRFASTAKQQLRGTSAKGAQLVARQPKFSA